MVTPLHRGRLGRGLASLIGESQPQAEARLPLHGEQRLLPIAELHPSGLNPRKDFDEAELAELATSIRAKGLVQPIIARPDRERGGYEIVAGERRWRAAQRASMHEVPVILRELSDSEAAEFALIENVQRADLNPIEEAAGYNELIERFKYTHEQLSETLGKSRSYVGNTLRLLKLPESAQVLVREGKLAAGAARAIVGHRHADVFAEEGRSFFDRLDKIEPWDAVLDLFGSRREPKMIAGVRTRVRLGPSKLRMWLSIVAEVGPAKLMTKRIDLKASSPPSRAAAASSAAPAPFE